METTDFCTIYKILQSYELRIFQHNDLDSLRKQPISAGIIGLLHIHFLAVPDSPALMKLLSSNLKTLRKFLKQIILVFQKKKKTLTLRIKLEYLFTKFILCCSTANAQGKLNP
jgi:hypothetical protein